jgi:hypothetical protein
MSVCQELVHLCKCLKVMTCITGVIVGMQVILPLI